MNKDFFTKEYTNSVKGVAIILMVCLHLLQERWMPDSSMIIDYRLNGVPLSSIIAYACDSCIGIFAFITGYGWATSFEKKKVLGRIGPLYQTYWIVLVLFALPARILSSMINSEPITIDAGDILLSVVGIRSASVMFQWYIFFFACAVLTFKPLWSLTKRIRLKDYQKILLFIVVSIFPRFILSVAYRYVMIPGIIRDEISHYISWMPVILIGAVVKESKVLERVDELINKRSNDRLKLIGCILFPVGCIVVKALIQHVSGITTNIDAIFILPFMYSTIYVIRRAYGRLAEKSLRYLGGVSIYIWLMHRVFLYNPLRMWTLRLRLPVLIICAAITMLIPFAIILKYIDHRLTKFL